MVNLTNVTLLMLKQRQFYPTGWHLKLKRGIINGSETSLMCTSCFSLLLELLGKSFTKIVLWTF